MTYCNNFLSSFDVASQLLINFPPALPKCLWCKQSCSQIQKKCSNPLRLFARQNNCWKGASSAWSADRRPFVTPQRERQTAACARACSRSCPSEKAESTLSAQAAAASLRATCVFLHPWDGPRNIARARRRFKKKRARVTRGKKGSLARVRDAHESDVAAGSISGSCNSHCSPLSNARLCFQEAARGTMAVVGAARRK